MNEAEGPYTPKNCRVSVAMATCNGASYIEKQLASLFNQTLAPAEIIICDDISNDHTIQVIEKYTPGSSLSYHINHSRLGVIDNFKKAVSLTTTDNYIALCDQDDIWLPDKIEASARVLSDIDDGHTPALIYSDLLLMNEQDDLIAPSVWSQTGQDKYVHCLQTLLFGNFITGCTVMMNPQMRSLFSDIPNHPAIMHDAWMGLIAFSFGKATSLNQAHIKYRKHQSNVTFSKHKKRNRLEKIVRHIKSVFNKNNYLENELMIAKEFYHRYQQRLSDKDKNMILEFLRLEGASYARKKWAFEKAFRNHWLQRF